MMLWKYCTQHASKFGKLSSGQGLEKVSFHSNPKERQCQRMLKLPHNCTHLTLNIRICSNFLVKYYKSVKKIRDTKVTFHAKMGSIKGRNGRDLREAEDIKKRWQQYSEGLYKKDLHDPDNHDGVITHLEPGILDVKSSGLRKHHYKQS